MVVLRRFPPMTPHPRLLMAFALPVLALAGAAVLQIFPEVPAELIARLQQAAILWNGAVFVAALLDLLLSPRLTYVTVERETADAMSVGARNVVKVWLTSRNIRPIAVE